MRLIIYLDESGDLGFNFKNKKTSRYIVIGLLVFLNGAANTAMINAVKKTLKNKLPKNTLELKGSNLAFPIKKYFLKEINKQKDWRLYAAIADKKSWVEHHVSNHHREPEKKALYDEITKRLLSQLDFLEMTERVDIVVDRSKNKDEISLFDKAIMVEIKKRVPKKTPLTITHRSSHGAAGLQAVDIFCYGIWRKYEFSDFAWYKEFSDRIAVEVKYKF